MKEKIGMVNMMLVNAQIAQDQQLIEYLRKRLADMIAMYKKELVR
jgi:hypothetical protein